jgi:hypothetical protein
MKVIVCAALLCASSPALAEGLHPLAPWQTNLAPPRRELAEPGMFEWGGTKMRLGAGSFVAGYTSAVVWAAAGDRDRDALYVPVFGPWIELFTLPDCSDRDFFCDHPNADRALLIVEGALQTAGVYLVVADIIDMRAETRERSARIDRRVRIAPTAQRGPGVVMFGRF